MTKSETILTVNSISKSVTTQEGLLTILDGISFAIKAGETLAITGASGSGKSTLLSLLAGLDTPTSGSIELYGEQLNSLDEDHRAEVRGKYVGFVFQSFHLLPNLTALENVLLPQEIRGIQSETEARHLLAQVGLEHRLQHYPKQLSGGEQQRVAIARAFISGPKILFADEPTGNLDLATGQRIIELLFDLNKAQGTTLILVTHDNELASRCQRRLELCGGQMVTQQ